LLHVGEYEQVGSWKAPNGTACIERDKLNIALFLAPLSSDVVHAEEDQFSRKWVSMTKSAGPEGYKNWGRGPETGRPTSVGPHDIKQDQTDPNNPGLDPESYHPKPGDNNNRVASDPGPSGPVIIPVKGQSEPEIVPETGKPRTGG
jgi:hypothetical protein